MVTRIPGLLHDHIDGSIAVMDVIGDLYILAKKEFPFPSVKAWLDYFQNPHENIVQKFSTITDVVQTREALEMLGFAYGRHRAEEGYVYCEAKFAPQLHVFEDLTMKQVVEAMTKGLWAAQKEFGIRILPQLCIDRATTPEQGVEVARLCLEYDGEVAMDLACDEANHPPEKHMPAYELTLASNVRRDCHAGEWVLPEAKATHHERLLRNIRIAVRQLKVDSVGHAIPLIDDPELIKEMADKGVRVTGCPAAYVDAGLIGHISELGIPQLLDAGIIYTINPDDDLFLPPMDKVISAVENGADLTKDHWQQLADNVIKGAFAPDADRFLKK